MSFLSCDNAVWGSASNPWKISRIAGTSSDAALVASRVVNFALSEDFIGE